MKKIFVAISALAVLAGLGASVPASATVEKAKDPTIVTTYDFMVDGSVKVNSKVESDPSGKLAKGTRVASAAASCTVQPDGKCYWYSGDIFAHKAICFQNNIGVYWNYENAQNGFESGTSTVNFYNHGPSTNTPSPCSTAGGWEARQILTYNTYNSADGRCAHTEIHASGGIINGPTIAWMNLSPSVASCRATLQIRNNTVSQTIGATLGLIPFSSSTNLTASVMNTYFQNSYNYPGTDDRNALYWAYYSTF